MEAKHLIHELPKDVRPRERLESVGAKALSNAELFAILLRTGTRQRNVLQLAHHLLVQFETLNAFKHASLNDYMQIAGIGKVKALEIQAMVELGQRIAHAQVPKYGEIHSTDQAGEWLMREMGDLKQEHLLALMLNTKNQIIKKSTIFIGSLNSSVAHPREIFMEALKYPTASIIIAHNHPSGDTTPSHADLMFTQRLCNCGDLIGIRVLDHIIVGENDFNSLAQSTDIFV